MSQTIKIDLGALDIFLRTEFLLPFATRERTGLATRLPPTRTARMTAGYAVHKLRKRRQGNSLKQTLLKCSPLLILTGKLVD
jgi:hypothetical protein